MCVTWTCREGAEGFSTAKGINPYKFRSVYKYCHWVFTHNRLGRCRSKPFFTASHKFRSVQHGVHNNYISTHVCDRCRNEPLTTADRCRSKPLFTASHKFRSVQHGVHTYRYQYISPLMQEQATLHGQPQVQVSATWGSYI